MPLPHDFADECLYDERAWFIHDVLELSAEEGLVRAVMDTTRLGVLVDAQRVLPGHPKHLPGAVAIQVTGILGQLHAVYNLGLRASEGWSGFGTHVHSAKFHSMGEIGPPVMLEARVLRHRQLQGTHFLRFAFDYRQEGRRVFHSEQSAAWRKLDEGISSGSTAG